MVHCEWHGLILHPILQLTILKDCTDTSQGPATIRRPAHPVVLLPIGYNQIIGFLDRATGIFELELCPYSITRDECCVLLEVAIQLINLKAV